MSIWLPSGNGTWNSAGNWTGGVPNSSGAVADFTFSGTTGAALIDLPDTPSITLGTLNVTLTNQMGMIIRGPTTGIADLIFSAVGGAQVNVDSLAASPNGYLRIINANLNVQLASNLTFNVINAGSIAQLAAPTSGSGSLIKTGQGTLELNGSNTFTGGIQVQGGTLDAIGDAALGSGSVTLSNLGIFRSAGTVNQTIATVTNAAGTAGSGSITASALETLTLTGALNHAGQGTLLFGSTTDTGTVVASFGSIGHNTTLQSFRVAGGTLKMGDAFNAANLFNYLGIGLTELSGNAVIDTNGFATTISNLDLDAGTIRSSTGALNLTVFDVFIATNAQSGTFEGTANADSLTINANFGFSLSAATFTNWTTGTDVITLNGSSNGNSIAGSTLNDVINGFEGIDSLNGNGGIDTLNGGAGNDTFLYTNTNNGSSIDGGDDSDTIAVNSGSVTFGSLAGIEGFALSAGTTTTITSAQASTGLALTTAFIGSGAVVFDMTPDVMLLAKLYNFTNFTGTLTINGSSGADNIRLGNYANTVTTGGGINVVQGGGLVDIVTGGSGIDKIAGNGGADILTGGLGADVFKFRAAGDSGLGALADTIMDFQIGTDRLNFVKIDANASLAGDQAFTFIGTALFTNTGSGQIRYQNSGLDLLVSVDVNGDGTADMSVILHNLTGSTLTAADFVL